MANSDLGQVKKYRELVQEYEALDEKIDALLERNEGSTGKMSDEDYEHYREMANRRDYVYNQMKVLERRILMDDEDESQ